MEFWSTIVGLLRRPKVVVPILLAALILSFSSINVGVNFVQRNIVLQEIAKYCKK